jgi:hypothetical protein
LIFRFVVFLFFSCSEWRQSAKGGNIYSSTHFGHYRALFPFRYVD